MKSMVMEKPMGMGERIKGAWSKEEDDLLRDCIQRYGEGKWYLVPQRAGINRCRKSCRLRWVNYLRPNIKRGNFNEDEIDMIMRFHRLLGNRWSLIAARFPGRTSNDVKNLYNTYIRKRKIHNNSCQSHHPNNIDEHKHEEGAMKANHHQVIKPQPLSFPRNSSCFIRGKLSMHENRINHDKKNNNDNNMTHHLHHIEDPHQRNIESEKGNEVGCVIVSQEEGSEKSRDWWESLLEDVEKGEESNRLWCLGGEKDEGLNFLDDFWDEQLINYLA